MSQKYIPLKQEHSKSADLLGQGNITHLLPGFAIWRISMVTQIPHPHPPPPI